MNAHKYYINNQDDGTPSLHYSQFTPTQTQEIVEPRLLNPEMESEYETDEECETQNQHHFDTSRSLFETQDLTQTQTTVFSRKTALELEITNYKDLPLGYLRDFANKNEFEYSTQKFCPLGPLIESFWEDHRQQFPILSELALRVLNVPASSSIIERTFSKLSRYVTKERNLLKSKTLSAFVQSSELDSFDQSAQFLFRKHGKDFEPFKYVVGDEISSSVQPDFSLFD